MKKFMQKNLPFLSILIIATLFLTPFILAVEWTGMGDVSGFTGFGDISGFTGFGDVSGFTGLGDTSFTGLGDGTTDVGETPIAQPDEDGTADEGTGPFDPVFNTDPADPIHPGGDEIPPLDDAFEATIGISLSDSPDPVQPGDELVYTITYHNRGNGDARDVIITADADPLSPIQSTEPSATTGNYQWNLGVVESGERGTITITTNVKNKAEDGQTLANTVSIIYFDPVYGDKTTSVTEYTQVKVVGTEESDDDAGESIGIKILSTRFPVQSATGEPIFMSLHIENDGTESLEDVKIAIVSQDLGIRTSAGPFDLGRGDDVTKTLLLDIPADAPEGNYFLRFTITSNGNTRRVVYRDIDLVATLE